MLRMLYPIYCKQVYTWGFVRWGRLAKEIQNYEKEYVDFLLLSDGRHVLEVSYTTTIRCLEEDKVWSTISWYEYCGRQDVNVYFRKSNKMLLS